MPVIASGTSAIAPTATAITPKPIRMLKASEPVDFIDNRLQLVRFGLRDLAVLKQLRKIEHDFHGIPRLLPRGFIAWRAKAAVSSAITTSCRSGERQMNAEAPAVRGHPRMILMLEGFALFALCIFAYAKLGYSWWLFGALILAPDLGMIGYLRNAKAGRAAL